MSDSAKQPATTVPKSFRTDALFRLNVGGLGQHLRRKRATSLTDLSQLMETPVMTSAASPLSDPTLNNTARSDLAPAQPQPSHTDISSSPYLGGIATARPTVDRAVISHYTVHDVECNVEGRDLGSAARNIQHAIDGLEKLPKGISVHLRGQSETMYSSFECLGLGLLIAISLVYLLMVVLFQSWLDPLIIMIAVPGAMSGILWMLMATGTTLNVESLMGAIMAVGIAVSNSILLVNFANDGGWNTKKSPRNRPHLRLAVCGSGPY